MKKSMVFALLLVSTQSTYPLFKSWHDLDPLSKTAALAAASVATWLGYTWLRTPDTSPITLERLEVATTIPLKDPVEINNDTTLETRLMGIRHEKKPIQFSLDDTSYQAQLGIPNLTDHEYVVICSLGSSQLISCSKKYPAFIGYRLLKEHIIPPTIPCVTFNYPDTKHSEINFGQSRNIASLKLIIDSVKARNPKIKIILFGVCLGCTTIMNMLAHEPSMHTKDIAALVFESPLLSLQDLFTKQLFGLANLCHPVCRLLFPSYDANYPTILSAQSLPNIPTLIGAITCDSFTKEQDIKKIAQKMSTFSPVYLHTCNAAVEHAKLFKDKQFQKVVNEFYASYELDHNKELAQASAQEGLLAAACDIGL